MNKVYDILIIGGGYSSLILANLIKKDKKVAILERLNRVGKKILSTGNGRANISNNQISTQNYHGNNPDFCKYAIENYGADSLKKFYQSFGLMLCEIDGKIYPQSLQANAVLDTLRLSIGKNVEIFTETKVIRIFKSGNMFEIFSENGKFLAKNVVCAFGGKSQKQFGTMGDSYSLVTNFGHSVTPLRPSLVQLKCDQSFIKSLQGVKVNARVSLISGDSEIKTTTGDLLFSKGGLSGNSVFYLSAYFDKGDELRVDFVPNYDVNRLIAGLLNRKSKIGEENADELLTGILNKAIAKIIIKQVTDKKLIKEITQGEIEKAVQLAKNYKFKISGTYDFDMSQVTHGGIDTRDISDKTMMSKLVDNLFFMGEAVDIDGDCGGYNMHWAYASACVVGKVLNDKID